MKPTDFARLLTRYLGQYLPGQRNLSPHTIQSYRDTFTLLLRYGRDQRGWVPEALTLAALDRPGLEGFLDWLEQARHCSIATRNQRLAALHAFFRYVAVEAPEHLATSQRILGIPYKRTAAPVVGYLTPSALQRLLTQPDRTTRDGRRDAVLLAVLYDTGARVQELLDLVVRDCRLTAPAVVTLTGKGRKGRQVPLMAPTVALLTAYVAERRLDRHPEHPLFFNRQRRPLTRAGVTYILTKYSAQARAEDAAGFPARVTPHVLRHTKAMHLVQAHVNLIYIRDLLGHTDVATTEIYARADAEVKRAALAQAYATSPAEDARPRWEDDPGLMQWLRRLCSPDGSVLPL